MEAPRWNVAGNHHPEWTLSGGVICREPDPNSTYSRELGLEDGKAKAITLRLVESGL